MNQMQNLDLVVLLQTSENRLGQQVREGEGWPTLIQVIRLVFEKAMDDATWSEMYARLCRKTMEQISTNVQDDGIKTRNSEGKPITGGQLFRKYLLNR